jgi:hypothetical protein
MIKISGSHRYLISIRDQHIGLIVSEFCNRIPANFLRCFTKFVLFRLVGNRHRQFLSAFFEISFSIPFFLSAEGSAKAIRLVCWKILVKRPTFLFWFRFLGVVLAIILLIAIFPGDLLALAVAGSRVRLVPSGRGIFTTPPTTTRHRDRQRQHQTNTHKRVANKLRKSFGFHVYPGA